MKKKGILFFAVLFNITAASAVVAYAGGTDNPDLDKSPPDSYMESIYGWHDHAVTARLTADDALSGIAVLSYMMDGSSPEVSYTGNAELLVSTEGIHRIEYSSLDNAGNIEQPKMSLVKLDLTAPEISIISPGQRSYLHSDIIAIDFSGTDALSGIFSITGNIKGTPVTGSRKFDMLNLIPGVHEFESIAVDNAGNTRSSSVNFTVVVNIDSLGALNNRAITSGWIGDTETAGSLSQKLTLARQMIDSGQKELANNMIKSYMTEIESKRGKTVTEYGADILTKEAAYMYIFNV